MRGEMFQRGDDVFLILEHRITLKTSDGREAKLRHEIWIFAKCFFHAAPNADRAPRPTTGVSA